MISTWLALFGPYLHAQNKSISVGFLESFVDQFEGQMLSPLRYSHIQKLKTDAGRLAQMAI